MRFEFPWAPLTALLCGGLLLSPVLRAQTPQESARQASDARSLIKPDAKRAKKIAELAAKLEAAGDYEGALASYEEAARYAPFDVVIVGKGVALRSRLVRTFVDNAERAALEGNLDGATQQLAGALRVDPGNPAVIERLKQMQSMRAPTDEPEKELPTEGLPVLAPQHAVHSFQLRTDVRNAYEQVAASYGIKASFDPDLPARPVRLNLDNADFDTAMKILTMESGTFWRPLNPTLLFVAPDTAEKRRNFDLEIEQTFALPTAVDSSEVTELARVLRELTGIQHLQQSAPSHTITVRDTVQKVHLAGEIIRDLEQARGEMLLEIDLLEVDRNKAANLGITPPASERLISLNSSIAQQVRSASSLTALLTILATVFGGPAGSAAGGAIGSLASSIPPVAAIGGGKSTYLLTLPSFSADFSEALSLVHSGRQVFLRAQENKPATFFVGDRYPVTLSLLSGSLGTGGFTANPGGVAATIPTEQFNVGNGPVSIVTADFRTNGSADLAVLNEIDNTLTILFNQGTGAAAQFAPTASSPISLGAARTSAPAVPAALAVGSLNTLTDSFPDLVVTDPVANTVTVLLENAAANGSFTIQPNPIAVGRQPSAIVLGAFNSNTNNNLGFVVTNFTDNTISVFNGNADGTFTQVTGSPFALPTTTAGPIAMVAADFNGDGRLDLAIVNRTTNNVTILAGNGDGTFSQFPNSPISVGHLPVAIAEGALSGSTGPALAIVNQQDNSLTVLLGNGNGTFVPATQSPLATSATPSGVVIGSFLQGSTGGIAVSNTGAGTVTVFADLGSGLFSRALEPAAGTSPDAILAGNFTSSGFPDVAVTNNISGSAGMVTLIISPTSLISNPAISQQPYPGSEYVDLGLKIKATPSLHQNKEVTLQLEFEIKALAGSSVNGIPVISNRSVTQTVRVKEDETSLISGVLDREETNTITGLPGFATLPVAGYLFGSRSKNFSDDELLVLITPHRLRIPLRQSRSIYAGRGDTTGRGGFLGTQPAAPIPQPEPTPPPVEQPAPPPQPAPEPQPQPPQS